MVDVLADALKTAAQGAKKPLVGRWTTSVAVAAEAEAARAQLQPSELGADLLAIMDRETNGVNILGDGGHGHGLMQIDDRTHAAFLAANENGMDPATNIREGARIYVDALVHMRRVALTMATPPSEETIRGAAAAAYNAGETRTAGLLARTSDPVQIDSVTTGKNYGRDVRRRAREFASHLPPEACTPAGP